MRAIIIAAGSATRLGRYSEELPKSLLDVNGKTILERQVSLYRKNGVNDVIVIVGPYSEKFTLKGVTYIQDLDYDKHDIMGSLMAAKKEIFGEVIISYSDVLFDQEILKQVLDFKNDIGIATDPNWEKSYVGRTKHQKTEAENILIHNRKILKIKKNMINCEKDEMLAEFLGLLKLSAKGSEVFANKISYLENSHIGVFHEAPSFQKSYLTDMIQELIDSSLTISPIFVTGKWCEVDTLQDLERARRIFL